MKDLAGHAALITGGSRRIGACTARFLHDKGMNVIVHYNSSDDDARGLADELNARRADSASLVRQDLADVSSPRRLVDKSAERHGRLDALVNNASVFHPTPLAGATPEQWRRVMDTNLAAPFFLCQAAAPWLARTGGSIVNMADIYAERPLPEHAIYSASKAGIVSLTRSLAQELAPAVRVNAVAPGAILWPQQGLDEAARERMLSRTPMQRAGEPQDIAATIHFLIAGPDYITGQVINVDGGRGITP